MSSYGTQPAHDPVDELASIWRLPASAGKTPVGADVPPSWNPVPQEVLQSCSMAMRKMGDTKVASIAVTSTSAGEGRTTVAAGMALTAARDLGRRVVLLDLDTDGRGVAELGSLADTPGLLQLLHGEARIEECLQRVDNNVDVIVAGGPCPLPELATRMERLDSLIVDLVASGRVIVADLPPLMAGAGTARMADLFQTVALVVRAGAVPVPMIQAATAALGQQPVAIMNRVPGPRRSLLSRIGRRR